MRRLVILVLQTILFMSLIACFKTTSSTIDTKPTESEDEVSIALIDPTSTTLEPNQTPSPTEVPAATEVPTETPTPTPAVPTLKDYFSILSENQREALIQDQGNKHNDATFLSSNGWIFGCGFDKQGHPQLEKQRTDLSEKTALTKGYARNLYTHNAWLYAVIYEGISGTGIYRMRVSGEDIELLQSITSGTMQVWNDQIYFTDEGKDCHLYRMSLQGSNITEVIAKPVYYFYVVEDIIYYQDDNDNESLHVLGANGKDTKLNNDVTYWPIFDGEYFYYVKKQNNDQRSIWRVDVTGENDKKVADCNVTRGFLLYQDRLYFISGDDHERIYCINKDGSNLQLITQDTGCDAMQFMGDILKYDLIEVKNDQIYLLATKLCKADGTLIYSYNE